MPESPRLAKLTPRGVKGLPLTPRKKAQAQGRRAAEAADGIRALKEGSQAVKYSFNRLPRTTEFKLSNDEGRLSWHTPGRPANPSSSWRAWLPRIFRRGTPEHDLNSSVLMRDVLVVLVGEEKPA